MTKEERQGEQKPTIRERYENIAKSDWFKKTHEGMSVSEENLESKPKFKVGDWIISNYKQSTYQVVDVKRGMYVIRDVIDNHEYNIGIDECEKHGRKWTIEDAKHGDVLAFKDDSYILLVKEVHNTIYGMRVSCYCHVLIGKFETAEYQIRVDGLYPATKEQRDILFKKMHEEGYEWDAKTKKLYKKNGKNWTEEDDTIICELIRRMESLDHYWNRPTDQKLIEWIKSLKRRIE